MVDIWENLEVLEDGGYLGGFSHLRGFRHLRGVWIYGRIHGRIKTHERLGYMGGFRHLRGCGVWGDKYI